MSDPIREFQDDRIKLLTFIERNQAVFDLFFELADRYNGSLVEAKQHVRDTEPAGPVTIGPFRRSNAPTSVVYAPGRLDAAILAMPGVVKQVDTDALERLVMSGAVDAARITAAKTVVVKTASITGPKELVVKL